MDDIVQCFQDEYRWVPYGKIWASNARRQLTHSQYISDFWKRLKGKAEESGYCCYFEMTYVFSIYNPESIIKNASRIIILCMYHLLWHSISWMPCRLTFNILSFSRSFMFVFNLCRCIKWIATSCPFVIFKAIISQKMHLHYSRKIIISFGISIFIDEIEKRVIWFWVC